MEPFQSFAFGLDLELTPSDKGGRETPIVAAGADGSDYLYRPNWGLPEMVPPEQTGAPVFRFSTEIVHPGDRVKAVVLVPYPMTVDDWNLQVDVGCQLPMYEGNRVCGLGTILWKKRIELPLSDIERGDLSDWLGQDS